jgi:hypothetical protein
MQPAFSKARPAGPTVKSSGASHDSHETYAGSILMNGTWGQPTMVSGLVIDPRRDPSLEIFHHVAAMYF